MKKTGKCTWVDSRNYTPRIEGVYTVEKGKKAGLDTMGVHWRSKEVLERWREGIVSEIIEKLDLKECKQLKNRHSEILIKNNNINQLMTLFRCGQKVSEEDAYVVFGHL